MLPEEARSLQSAPDNPPALERSRRQVPEPGPRIPNHSLADRPSPPGREQANLELETARNSSSCHTAEPQINFHLAIKLRGGGNKNVHILPVDRFVTVRSVVTTPPASIGAR